MKLTVGFAGAADINNYLMLRQHIRHDIAPLNDRDRSRVIDDFSQFVSDDTRFIQAIKVEMVHRQPLVGCDIFTADRERRAGNMIAATHTLCQAAGKRCLTTPKVTRKDDNLTAPEM